MQHLPSNTELWCCCVCLAVRDLPWGDVTWWWGMWEVTGLWGLSEGLRRKRWIGSNPGWGFGATRHLRYQVWALTAPCWTQIYSATPRLSKAFWITKAVLYLGGLNGPEESPGWLEREYASKGKLNGLEISQKSPGPTSFLQQTFKFLWGFYKALEKYLIVKT